MYVCMSLCIHAFAGMCTYVCMHVSMHLHTCTFHIRVYVCICRHVHTCMFHIRVYVCICRHVRIHVMYPCVYVCNVCMYVSTRGMCGHVCIIFVLYYMHVVYFNYTSIPPLQINLTSWNYNTIPFKKSSSKKYK